MRRFFSLFLLLSSLTACSSQDDRSRQINQAVVGSTTVSDSVNLPEMSEGSTWMDSLKSLQEGNVRFVNNTRQLGKDITDKRLKLVSGQTPKAAIISCADSRVIPELIFDQCIGDLFVIRSAGNVVDGVLDDSINYAIKYLHAPLVVILGHEGCGAIQAVMSGQADQMGLEHIARLIRPAITPIMNIQVSDQDRLHRAIVANARDVLSHIEESPTAQSLIQSGQVRLVVGYYSMESGTVTFYDVDTLESQGQDLSSI